MTENQEPRIGETRNMGGTLKTWTEQGWTDTAYVINGPTPTNRPAWMTLRNLAYAIYAVLFLIGLALIGGRVTNVGAVLIGFAMVGAGIEVGKQYRGR